MCMLRVCYTLALSLTKRVLLSGFPTVHFCLLHNNASVTIFSLHNSRCSRCSMHTDALRCCGPAPFAAPSACC